MSTTTLNMRPVPEGLERDLRLGGEVIVRYRGSDGRLEEFSSSPYGIAGVFIQFRPYVVAWSEGVDRDTGEAESRTKEFPLDDLVDVAVADVDFLEGKETPVARWLRDAKGALRRFSLK